MAAGSSCPGRTSPASRPTAWSAAGSTSTRCWPGTRRRPAPGCWKAHRHRAGARRAHRPGHRRHRAAANGAKADRDSAPRSWSPRRQLVTALARDGPAQARGPADGCRGAPLLHQPPARRRLPGVVAGALGRRAQLLPGYGWIFGMGDGTQQRRPRDPEHLRRRSARPTTGRCCAAGWTDARRSGASARRTRPPDPRRRAADGLQPHPALHRRPAAGRRRRRHGQPVQRRGHRLRDGVRRDRRRGIVQALARPTAAGTESACCGPTRRS